MPRVDWLNSFKERHNLTQRLSDNVKGTRAEVTQETIHKYFDNLSVTLEGVAPGNLYNYDETNVTDDPGAKKVIVHRGIRRIERKIEHSKQSISVMFCGNAKGEFLPPMVVYKVNICTHHGRKAVPEEQVTIQHPTDGLTYGRLKASLVVYFCLMLLENLERKFL